MSVRWECFIYGDWNGCSDQETVSSFCPCKGLENRKIKRRLVITETKEVLYPVTQSNISQDPIAKPAPAPIVPSLSSTVAGMGRPKWTPVLYGRFQVQSGSGNGIWVMPAKETDRYVRVLDLETGVSLTVEQNRGATDKEKEQANG